MSKSFPKILQLGDPRVVEQLATGVVDITEKVDGSLFSFGLSYEDELQYRSKGQDLTNNPSPQKLFLPAIAGVLDRTALIGSILKPGEWVFGETLSSPHHNTLSYERVPKDNFIVFGYFNQNGWANIEEVQVIASKLGYEVVPHIYSGPMPSLPTIEQLLTAGSVLGKELIEGVVVRHRSAFWAGFGSEPSPVLVKYVRPEFKERNSATWEGVKTSSSGKVELILEGYRTEARWNKAIQHLWDNDQLQGRMQDMPLLVQEVEKDVVLECEAEIKEAIWKAVRKDLMRTVNRGLAEHYKMELAKGVVEGVEVQS